MNREARQTIAQETLTIIERGEYVPRPGSRANIAKALSESVSITRVFKPEELASLIATAPSLVSGETRFDVRNETTLSAAARLVVQQGHDRVLCLNFASAKNPGGGFLGGSQAQEESLARSSGLYASLCAASEYYDVNRRCGTALYTDHMILSPNVTVFRNDAGDLLDTPYDVAFLTAPAANAGAVQKNERNRAREIIPTMDRRIAMVLAVAANCGYRHLVLGAWGCGVFRNHPADIAKLFAKHLSGNGAYAKCFEQVVFAVLDKPNGNVIKPFQQAFAGSRKGV